VTAFCALEIVLDGGQVFALLMTQIAFAGAFDHLPIREYLIPFLRLSIGFHFEQM
jgi:hypothetical protein